MITAKILNTLEFDRILHEIAAFSNSETSSKLVLEIVPLKTKEAIGKRFGQIREILKLCQNGNPLRLSAFSDISGHLEKAIPKGAVIEAPELLAFIPVLRIISDITIQLKRRNDIPLLQELTNHLTGFPEILSMLEKSIDNTGNLVDNASPELLRLRSALRNLEKKISKQLEEITRNKKISPFLQDTFISKRAERWVLPVRMDSKGQVHGVVHDVSRSGETAFIEPIEIIGLTNEFENTIAEEKTEQICILRGICEAIRRSADDILIQFRIIVYLDMLNSISRFAELLNMAIPLISDSLTIRLAGARHPLLMLLQKKKNRDEVIPLNLRLDGDSRAMVITGPNAGGKTITIKTVGLLLLMAISGMPVPADSSSTFPVIDKMLVDIGDEQSIENSLSTFSAHISNISEILKEADSKTIILMDELGTGTEPRYGAAISCAVLNELKAKGALVLATTHLAEVTGFVHMTEGMINASMEFDQKTFSPLYHLITGEPGQSHALETAQKYGLPEKTIDFARKLLGSRHEDFHNLMLDMKEKRLKYENSLAEINTKKIRLKENGALLERKLAEAEMQSREIFKKTYEEAQEIIIETKRQMNSFLEEIKRKKNREAIKKIENTYNQVDKKLQEFGKETPLSINNIKEGDEIFVRSLGYDARVIGIETGQNRLRVRAGNMYMEIPLSEVSQKQGKEPCLKADSFKTDPSEYEIQSVLNIVGHRVDEAMSRVEPFLNHASLAGLSEVRIIHGIGTCALQKAVRGHLKGHPLVKQFRQGKQPEGGNGVTIVTIR